MLLKIYFLDEVYALSFKSRPSQRASAPSVSPIITAYQRSGRVCFSFTRARLRAHFFERATGSLKPKVPAPPHLDYLGASAPGFLGVHTETTELCGCVCRTRRDRTQPSPIGEQMLEFRVKNSVLSLDLVKYKYL